MHWDSVLPTPGAKYCTGDISNMCLGPLLPDAEYVRFRYNLIPPWVIQHYNLDRIAHNGIGHANIKRAWYGVKQSGKIAHDGLRYDDSIASIANYSM